MKLLGVSNRTLRVKELDETKEIIVAEGAVVLLNGMDAGIQDLQPGDDLTFIRGNLHAERGLSREE